MQAQAQGGPNGNRIKTIIGAASDNAHCENGQVRVSAGGYLAEKCINRSPDMYLDAKRRNRQAFKNALTVTFAGWVLFWFFLAAGGMKSSRDQSIGWALVRRCHGCAQPSHPPR